MSFFDELSKIHHQLSVPSAIFMAMRGRVERLSGGYQNRIGSAFPNGDQSVLIFGPGGTGKTTCMSTIYNGLNLGSRGAFIESGGMATSIGLLEMIQDNSKSVTFLDEMDWDNKDHLSLFKQLANGRIYRQKSGSDVNFEFDGLVVASTNSITIPSGNKSEHLMATLDRFIVVKAEKANQDHNEILDKIISGDFSQEKEEIDWNLIQERMNSDWDAPVTLVESNLIKEVWAKKHKECLNSNQEHFRNMHRVKDCLLFVKRMTQSKDISKDKDLVKIFVDLVDDLVIVNRGNLIWMDRSQKEIFNIVKSSLVPLSPKDIMKIAEEKGYSVERRTMHRKLRVLVDQGFVFKYAHGKYWNKGDFVEKESDCLINI